MKTTKAIATPAISHSEAATTDVWLTSRQVKALRTSITPETLQELVDYQEEIWDVLCTAHGLSMNGAFDSGETAPADAFVKMLIADSRSIREAALQATDKAQRAAKMANFAITTDPLWKLDPTGIRAFKE